MESTLEYNQEKMRAVILRACHSCAPSDLGAVKLNKVLYFVDMITYAHHRQVVTGATYRKRPNGPASDQLLFTLRDMERGGEIEVNDVDYHGFIKKEYVAKIAEPHNALSNEQSALLDDVIDFVCRKNTAKSISDYSHQLPWEMAQMGSEIPYYSAMLLFPNQPSPEAFEAADEGMKDIETERSLGNSLGMSKLSDFRSRILEASGAA